MRKSIMMALTLAASLAASHLDAAEAPIQQLKDLAFAGQSAQAKKLFESTRPASEMLSAEWLAAMSWVGRSGTISGDWELAADYAEATLAGCDKLLGQNPLGTDPDAPLAIALGAAVETLAKFHVAMNERGMAVVFLRERLSEHMGTGVETRINKNLLLLDLVGKPMPALDTRQFLGMHRSSLADMEGKVALFFFWAHWCSDCRAQKPILMDLERRYADKGLLLVAPTRLYGYIERGRDAAPPEERAFVERTYVRSHPLLGRVPVPLSTENFVRFGVSSTPTLVLVDRGGVVRLYHPGFIESPELAQRIEALL